MDECRKEFEEWCVDGIDHTAKIPEEIKKTLIDGMWTTWQAAWSARTEAKVSGDVVTRGERHYSISQTLLDKLLRCCDFENCDDTVGIYVETYAELKALAPQPAKTVSKEAIKGGIISVKDHHDPESWDRLIDLIYDLQLPAPQSPVVPGVDRWVNAWEIDGEIDEDGMRRDSNGAWVKYDDIAHLLANARESREGVVAELIRTARNASTLLKAHGFVTTALDKALATVGKEG